MTNAEEKYTLEQIIDAITQADDAVMYAVEHKDRELLESCLQEYLGKENAGIIGEVKSEEEAEELQKLFAAGSYDRLCGLPRKDKE